MLSQKVKQEIKHITDNFLITNIFIKKAKTGKLNIEHIARYLKNILYMIELTPIHLKAAGLISREQGSLDIAKFMDEKYNEEFGHDLWVRADINKVETNLENQNHNTLTNSIIKLEQFVETLAYNDQLGYIAYITFLEYFTVLAAPPLLDYVENKCGIPKSMLTVVTKHGELDKIHVEDDLKAIDTFIDSPEKYNTFIKVIHMAAIILDQHFTECASLEYKEAV